MMIERRVTAYRLLRTGATHESEVVCCNGVVMMPYFSSPGRVSTLRVSSIDYFKAHIAISARRTGLGRRRSWWRW